MLKYSFDLFMFFADQQILYIFGLGFFIIIFFAIYDLIVK